jgi:hypothetical protein
MYCSWCAEAEALKMDGLRGRSLLRFPFVAHASPAGLPHISLCSEMLRLLERYGCCGNEIPFRADRGSFLCSSVESSARQAGFRT